MQAEFRADSVSQKLIKIQYQHGPPMPSNPAYKSTVSSNQGGLPSQTKVVTKKVKLSFRYYLGHSWPNSLCWESFSDFFPTVTTWLHCYKLFLATESIGHLWKCRPLLVKRYWGGPSLRPWHWISTASIWVSSNFQFLFTTVIFQILVSCSLIESIEIYLAWVYSWCICFIVCQVSRKRISLFAELYFVKSSVKAINL